MLLTTLVQLLREKKTCIRWQKLTRHLHTIDSSKGEKLWLEENIR